MDSEELSSLCSSLTLEEEKETITPDLEAGLRAQGERSIDRSLVGCILSTGPIARDAFLHRIKGVWKTKECFEVEAIRSNKFVFHFISTADKRRVLSGGPWCYQNKLLVLEELSGIRDYSKMSFSKVPFWLQLYNIPVFCMSKTVGSILGNMVGNVQEIECNQDGLCLGTFIRVRVVIDISKPLKRILKVRMGSNKELVTILFRYEHLPELCFHCSILGHPLKECPERGALQGDNLNLKYGAWIKAPPSSSAENIAQNKRRRPSAGSSFQAPLTGNIHHQPVTGPKTRHAQQPHLRLARPSNHPLSTSRSHATNPSPKWVCRDKRPVPSDPIAGDPPISPSPCTTDVPLSPSPAAGSKLVHPSLDPVSSGLILYQPPPARATPPRKYSWPARFHHAPEISASPELHLETTSQGPLLGQPPLPTPLMGGSTSSGHLLLPTDSHQEHVFAEHQSLP